MSIVSNDFLKIILHYQSDAIFIDRIGTYDATIFILIGDIIIMVNKDIIRKIYHKKAEYG